MLVIAVGVFREFSYNEIFYKSKEIVNFTICIKLVAFWALDGFENGMKVPHAKRIDLLGTARAFDLRKLFNINIIKYLKLYLHQKLR